MNEDVTITVLTYNAQIMCDNDQKNLKHKALPHKYNIMDDFMTALSIDIAIIQETRRTASTPFNARSPSYTTPPTQPNFVILPLARSFRPSPAPPTCVRELAHTRFTPKQRPKLANIRPMLRRVFHTLAKVGSCNRM